MCKAHTRRSREEGSIKSWVGRCWDILIQIWMEKIWEKKLISKRIPAERKKRKKRKKRRKKWRLQTGGPEVGLFSEVFNTLSSICLRAPVLMHIQSLIHTAPVQHFYLYPKSNFLANLEKMTMENVIRVPFIWAHQVWHSSVKRVVKLLSIDLRSLARKKKHTLILVYETCVSLQYFHRIYYFS